MQTTYGVFEMMCAIAKFANRRPAQIVARTLRSTPKAILCAVPIVNDCPETAQGRLVGSLVAPAFGTLTHARQ